MTDFQLIKQIETLKMIKPNKEWVFFTKARILGEEPRKAMTYDIFSYLRFLTYRPVLATAACLMLFIGVFAYAQNALPGDLLYPVKKLTEKSQSVFVSKDKMPQYQLEQTNKRLNEVVTIAQGNKINKISSAVNELKEVTKNLEVNSDSSEGVQKEAQKILANKEKAVQALGTMVADNEELNSAMKTLVEREINDLGSRTLTDVQIGFLNSAKQNFADGEYIRALENIWLISNTTEIQ